jgi:hypothetical protein
MTCYCRRSLVVACLLLAAMSIHREANALRLPTGTCPDAGLVQQTQASNELDQVDAVKEPDCTLKEIRNEADERLKRCPGDEEAQYELIRAKEMLLDYSASADEGSLQSLAKWTAEAVHRFPHSPRIALVDARARPEPGHVAALVARFPEFAPLRVALANAQLAAGDADAAAETIAAIKDLKLVYGAGETLAAIQLAKGAPTGALKTLANKRLWYVYPEEAAAGSEADGRMGRLSRQQAEIAYQAQLALHHPAAALRSLFDAAERGSKAAQALLKKPSPELAKAIAAARRSGKLSAIDREYLKK